MKGHRYDFIYEIDYGYKNAIPAISLIFNSEYWNYARMVSGMLRAEVDLPAIIEVIDSLDSEDVINVWKKGVSRALKQFIDNGTKSDKVCEVCGATLVYNDGCITCPGCGFSKCG